MSRTVIDLIAIIVLAPMIVLGLYLMFTSDDTDRSDVTDWFDDAMRTTAGFFLVSALPFWFIALWELLKNL